MRMFKDTENRTWQVAVNVGSIKRVRDVLGINLLEMIESKEMQALITDPMQVVDILYVMCGEQIESRSLSAEQFYAGLVGDVLGDAADALLEDLVDFFPRGRRELLRKAAGKCRTLVDRVLAAATARLDSGQIETELESLLRQEYGPTSGTTPASSESIPAP
ncbi:MAG: hypothetical protein ABFD92_07860 [Planctomycetaceae bacterium]|nr:hypothetical protein [Planctomycetaceae bacterium]